MFHLIRKIKNCIVNRRSNYEEVIAKDYVAAHEFSIYNKDQIVSSTKCGCFCCLKIFSPSKITEWTDPDDDTALCPYCGIDSVIGDASGYEITETFMKKMYDHWFGRRSEL